MAIRREAPNGVIVKFPDGTSEETIAEYLAGDQFKPPTAQKRSDKDRKFITEYGSYDDLRESSGMDRESILRLLNE